MLVIEEINKNGYTRIQEELGIKVKFDGPYVLLDYCQIDSPKLDPIVRECRGLILEKDTLKVVCRSFNRFFNYGEGDAQDLSFEGCRVVEKVDGSIIRVWYSELYDRWIVSTRGTVFADSEVMGNPFTFHDLFVKTFEAKYCREHESFQDFCRNNLLEEATYVFELATPYNRVVTRYEEDRVCLLAVFETSSGDISNFEKGWCKRGFGFDVPVEYDISSFEACVEASNSLGDLKEGFVVVDSQGYPICKIKSPAYVAVHHIRGEGLNPKRISQLVWSGEASEYLTYFPEDESIILPYSIARREVLDEILELWNKTKEIETQKDFALAVKDTPYFGVMFEMRKGGIMKDVINSFKDETKKDWLLAKIN